MCVTVTIICIVLTNIVRRLLTTCKVNKQRKVLDKEVRNKRLQHVTHLKWQPWRHMSRDTWRQRGFGFQNILMNSKKVHILHNFWHVYHVTPEKVADHDRGGGGRATNTPFMPILISPARDESARIRCASWFATLCMMISLTR